MFTAWLTSSTLIAAVKRKISMPIAQGLMSDQDILDFATEELLISQVPSILQYHEEYYVWPEEITIVAGQVKYPIPERAIGAKLRDIWYKDSSGNLYTMTRINPEDKNTYQRDSVGTGFISKYYLQGNNFVLLDASALDNTGTIQVEYFLRPNLLVPDERAAYVESYAKQLTVVNASLVAGDTFTFDTTVFTARASGAGAFEFNIGVSSAVTATNLSAALVTSGLVTASSAASNIITFDYDDLSLEFSSSSAGIVVSSQQTLRFTENVPDNITSGSVIDFLQTRPGHSMRKMDVTIPSASVSEDLISFTAGDVPENLAIGDYIALAGECIIPQIPTDLHTALTDRTCGRILAAIGDQAGVDSIDKKMAETELRQSAILNNRVEGDLPKVVARRSLLRQGKIGYRRGF